MQNIIVSNYIIYIGISCNTSYFNKEVIDENKILIFFYY